MVGVRLGVAIRRGVLAIYYPLLLVVRQPWNASSGGKSVLEPVINGPEYLIPTLHFRWKSTWFLRRN
jgi:hypothetical protein